MVLYGYSEPQLKLCVANMCVIGSNCYRLNEVLLFYVQNQNKVFSYNFEDEERSMLI